MKKTAIDLGLAVLCAMKPGRPLTRGDIATVCGCSEQRIYEIEQRALRKLRNPSRLKHLVAFGRD
jgi:DNA-directed RNA polymerase sigma subunit (sigma70/sigma32)